MSVVDKASTVLFLGAGASAPLGKMLMIQFVHHLEKHLGQSNPLFSDIVTRKRDLEFLLEALTNVDDIGYLQYHLQRHWEIARGGDTVVRREDRRRTEETFADLGESASNLRRYIEREVFNHYRAFDNEQSVVELLSPIITQ